MKKLLFIQVMWTPYNHARFSAIASECPNLDLHVFYQSSGNPYRRWKEGGKKANYRHLFLKNASLPISAEKAFTLNFNYNIFPELVKCRPDRVVVTGWDSPATLAALMYCKRSRREIILYSESTIHERSLQRTAFKPYVMLLVRFFDGFLSTGTASKEYLKSLGAKKNIEIFYNTVDVDHFMREGLMSDHERNKERAKNGLKPDSMILLFSGRLVPIKKVDMLIKAFKTIGTEKDNLELLIVGYGPEETKLKELSRGDARIRFLGHRDAGEIPRLYGMSDILVLPSIEEPWGLVVNEAMACGCAIVVSDRCGSSRDLVSGNGIVFEGGNQTALIEALRSILCSESRLRGMQKKSIDIIKCFRPQDLVKRISYFQ